MPIPSALHSADPVELVRSARRLAAVAEGLGQAAGEIAALGGELTEQQIGGGAPAIRAGVGELAASVRHQQEVLATAAAALIGHAQAVTLAQGGAWAAGDGELDPGAHPTPDWSRIGSPRPTEQELAELDRSARRTSAALAALFPEHTHLGADVAEVSRAMRSQLAARLGGQKVRPG
jgi:hypothetical protein